MITRTKRKVHFRKAVSRRTINKTSFREQ